MRTLLLISAGILMSGASAYAGPCPATIMDDESVPSGGSAQVEHKFRYVSFFEGDPKDQADLAPDADGADPGRLEQHWELTRMPGNPITMVCRYHGTDRTYAAVVPPDVKDCTLTGEMDEHGGVLGSPMLECK